MSTASPVDACRLPLLPLLLLLLPPLAAAMATAAAAAVPGSTVQAGPRGGAMSTSSYTESPSSCRSICTRYAHRGSQYRSSGASADDDDDDDEEEEDKAGIGRGNGSTVASTTPRASEHVLMSTTVTASPATTPVAARCRFAIRNARNFILSTAKNARENRRGRPIFTPMTPRTMDHSNRVHVRK